jgi:hypothetical protein
MSTLDSDPSLTETIGLGQMHPNAEEKQPVEFSSLIKLSFTEGVRSQIKQWTLTILAPLLIILKVTIIFACALLADTFILMIISWSFGSTISHNPFAADLLEGIQILSAFGTAVAYIIYLFRSLIKDTAEVLKEIREAVGDFRAKSN